MADTVLTSAIPGIHDEGLPNINDGNEDWGSAGLRMMLAQAVDGGSYVRSDSELTFTNHDGANDTVDVTAGVAYLDLAGETVQIQSGQGGDSPPAYDTTLPTAPAIPVIVPNTATVAVQDSTLSSVWVAYATDGAVTNVSAGDVYLRSDDTGSVTAPPHPSVEIGQANPDDASADTLLNRFGSPTFDELESTAVNTDVLNNRKYVDPNTADAGAAINSLLQELNTEGGGMIELPPGILPLSTQINLSPGVNISADTPVAIVGAGNVSRQDGNTVFDCSGLADDPIYQDGATSGIRLEAFGLTNVDGTSDGLHLGGATAGDSGYFRDGVIKDIIIDGGANIGAWLKSLYGTEVSNLHVRNCSQAVYGNLLNATSVRNWALRSNTGTAPVLELENCNGFAPTDLYIEGNNAARALSVYGPTDSLAIDGLYLEGNNKENATGREVVIGDTAQSAGTTTAVTIIGMRPATPSNGYGAERITVDDADRVTFKGSDTFGSGPFDFYATANAGLIDFEGCALNDVDTSNATKAARFEGCDIQGTVSYQTPRVPTDVSASRSIGTWYQNTTGRPLTVHITPTLNASGELRTPIHINDAQTDNRVARIRVSGGQAGEKVPYQTEIPPGHYYKLEDINGNAGVGAWQEHIAAY